MGWEKQKNKVGEKVRLDDYLSIITIELEIGQKKILKTFKVFDFVLEKGEGENFGVRDGGI